MVESCVTALLTPEERRAATEEDGKIEPDDIDTDALEGTNDFIEAILPIDYFADRDSAPNQTHSGIADSPIPWIVAREFDTHTVEAIADSIASTLHSKAPPTKVMLAESLLIILESRKRFALFPTPDIIVE
ncbi:hypothetical protein C8R45DRAFT_923289 [Mycena sanguinolenta]|nr:hypothetical protein C8R45DRAFT_923289 [Mycena sanguinolenta]